MNILHADWRKRAAAQLADDSDIEKAFLDSAYSAIANKARPIMQAPYRLGFEVVFKNDNNTRMVGIFAFRIGKDLFYAPVFFLNGEIKGTDLLYRHNTKKFVPLTEEWVNYLLESNNSEAGTGVPRQFTTQLQQHFNLNKLRSPNAGMGKMAATPDVGIADPAVKAECHTVWQEFTKLAAVTLPPALRGFIEADGGVSAVGLLGDAMEKNFKFASALVEHVGVDNFAPADLQSTVKQASGKAEPVLVLHTGAFEPEHVKCASEAYFQHGFWLEDRRKQASLATVFEEENEEIRSPGEAGVYELILKGGEQRKIFVAPLANDEAGRLACWSPVGGNVTTWLLVDPANGEHLTTSQPGMGKLIKGAQAADGDHLAKSMETGKGYCIFNPAEGTLSRPIWVKGKRTVDGVTHYTVYSQYSSMPDELRANPDQERVRLAEGVLGSSARFLEVKGKWESNAHDSGGHPVFEYAKFAPGSQTDVSSFVMGAGLKFASVIRQGVDLVLRTGAQQNSKPMNKVAMTCHLAKALRMHADVALDLVEKAASTGRAGFIYEPAKEAKLWYNNAELDELEKKDPATLTQTERSILLARKDQGAAKDRGEKRWATVAKSASAVMLQAEPQFDPMLDPQFNVNVEPHQRYTVGTDYQPEEVQPHRVGDAMDPANMRGALQTATPEQLAQMSAMGVPHIFEHGVVGELVKTYDAAAMIQKYIPDMEKALDCLGRILFLLYWKPEDLKKTYGSDDLTNKENEILSSFKAFGDLLLDLIKQTRPDRAGSVSMGT